MSKSMLDLIESDYAPKILDLSKESMIEGSFSLKRIVQIISVYLKVILAQKNVKFIYLTISESIAGNLKDLFIYLLCSFNLNKMVIHLHGGSLGEDVFKRNSLLKYINFFFFSKFRKIIVLSESHKDIFKGSVEVSKIEIISNFIYPDFLISKTEVKKKFQKKIPIKLIFLGNMIYKKGYLHLFNAFQNLDEEYQDAFELCFVGKFDSEEEKSKFLRAIRWSNRVRYLGELIGEEKKKVFRESHVFILPSMYREGQPLSILEAYASGCVVIATGQPGILDICSDSENGYIIQVGSIISLQKSLIRLLENHQDLETIALRNRNFADTKFSYRKFEMSVKNLFG